MWTSIQNKGYCALTAHYIDSNWNLQKRILNFFEVECPHTAEAISVVLLEKFVKWNVDKKIMCVVLDNCTTNDAVVKDIKNSLLSRSLVLDGQFLHVRCTTHY